MGVGSRGREKREGVTYSYRTTVGISTLTCFAVRRIEQVKFPDKKTRTQTVTSWRRELKNPMRCVVALASSEHFRTASVETKNPVEYGFYR